MSKDWTAAELKAASEAMKHMGFTGYEDFEAAFQKYIADKAHDSISRKEQQFISKEDEGK